MESYQYYIDDIQSAVYSRETADPDFLRDSAALYAEACAEVNDRLRQVARLLHRGLRGEAIQSAEEEPSLLDLVGVLDFPELSTWQEMLRQWGMAAPPPLLVDLAAEIDQAYTDQQPLESLLKRHRLLALGRAALSARIATLRQLARIDAANANWEEDVASLERARLKQIGDEANVAQRNDDLQTLTAIRTELNTDGWRVERPVSLVRRIDDLHNQLAVKLARKELQDLEKVLSTAHMAFDVPAGQKALGRWEQAAGVAKLQPSDALAERAAPALQWLAEQERIDQEQRRRQEAIAAVEQAIDADLPGRDLERLWQQCQVFDEPPPDALRHRVEHKLAAYALASKRRHRVILTAVVGGLVLVTGLVTFVIMDQRQRAAIADSENVMKVMVDGGQLDKAHDYFENLQRSSPRIAASTQIQKQRARLDSVRQAEENRRTAFESAITRLEQGSPESPDQAALAKARDLARMSSEKERVSTVEARIAAARRRQQQEQNEAISQRLVVFRDRLTELDASKGDADQDRLSDYARLRKEIEDGKSEFPQASPAVRAQLNPLVMRIDARLKELRSRQNEVEALARITESVGDVPAFSSALQTYADDFPESPISTNLASLQKERGLWEGLIAWSTFLTSSFGDKGNISAARAREMLQRGGELDASYGAVPLADFFRARKTYLRSVADRESDDGTPLAEELRKLFRDPLIGKLWMVESNDGLRYYCMDEPAKNNGWVRFKYITGFDLAEKPGTVREADVAYAGLAPQSGVAGQALKLIDELPERGWEWTFTHILYATTEKEQIDPILRVVLLQRILGLAGKGSTVLAQAFQPYRNGLDEVNVDPSVCWMDPRDDTAKNERRRVEVLLRGLPSLSDAIRETGRGFQEMQKPPEFEFRWVGWLKRQLDGTWQVRTKEALPSGKIVVIGESPGQATAQIRVIGEAEKNTFHLDGTSPTSVMEGRPVFIRVPVAQ